MVPSLHYDKWIGEYEVELNTLLKCPNYYTAPLYGKDGMCYGSIHVRKPSGFITLDLC